MIFKTLISFREHLKSNMASYAIWMGIVIYTLFFSIISFLRYDAFSFTDFDFAIFVHEYWKIAHGSADISIFLNTPIWGNALEVFSFLMAPVFAFCQFNPKSLLFFQAFILGLGAWPVFLIARTCALPARVATALAFSYLLNPSVWYSNLYEFNPLVFTTFGLLMAFYYYQTQQFLKFLVFCLLCLMNRLDIGITVGMFGLYALIERRPWKWVVVPSVISFSWVAIGLFIIVPNFKGLLGYDAVYPQFGSTFPEIIKNLFFHPQLWFKAFFTIENFNFLNNLFYPVMFFPLLGLKQFLICSLSLSQHLISTRSTEHTIFYHYTATVTPFVYISTIYVMARFQKFHKKIIFAILPIVFALSANCIYGPLSVVSDYRAMLQKDEMDLYKKKMLARITPTAPVISSFEFSPMLAGRYYYYSFHYVVAGAFRKGIAYPTPNNIEYAFVNFEDPRIVSFFHKNSDRLVRNFLTQGHFGVVDMAGSIALFKREYDGPLKLYEVKKGIQDEEALYSTKNGLRLVNFEVKKHTEGDWTLLNLAFHWQISQPIKDTAGILIVVKDSSGREIYKNYRFLGYGVYPSKRWEVGEEIVDYEQCPLLKLKTGEYKIYMALFSKDQNHRFYRLIKFGRNNVAGEAPLPIMLTTFENS